MRQRAREYRVVNGLDPEMSVPIDAVTGSASGLDPRISVANTRMQAERVALAGVLASTRCPSWSTNTPIAGTSASSENPGSASCCSTSPWMPGNARPNEAGADDCPWMPDARRLVT